MIKKLLTVNPKKRILLEEIKLHPFYKQGEQQIGKENLEYDKIKLNEKIVLKMESLGINKEEIIKNLEKNKHNNITTTYNLLYKKYKTSLIIKQSVSEIKEKVIPKTTITSRQQTEILETNPNININIKYLKNFGNININISDPKGTSYNTVMLKENKNNCIQTEYLYFF